MELALLISAVTSSLSAGIALAGIRWIYRIDRRTTRNHETLHRTANGPGITETVRENRSALLRNGLLKKDD